MIMNYNVLVNSNYIGDMHKWVCMRISSIILNYKLIKTVFVYEIIIVL